MKATWLSPESCVMCLCSLLVLHMAVLGFSHTFTLATLAGRTFTLGEEGVSQGVMLWLYPVLERVPEFYPPWFAVSSM